MIKRLTSKKRKGLHNTKKISDVFTSDDPQNVLMNSPRKTTRLKKDQEHNLELLMACQPGEWTSGVFENENNSRKHKARTMRMGVLKSWSHLPRLTSEKYLQSKSSSRLPDRKSNNSRKGLMLGTSSHPNTKGIRCAVAQRQSGYKTVILPEERMRKNAINNCFDSMLGSTPSADAYFPSRNTTANSLLREGCLTPCRLADFLTTEDKDIAESSMIVNISPSDLREKDSGTNGDRLLKQSISKHIQLYDAQLQRIKKRTDVLRERNIEIRERYERVRRKARLLHILDDDGLEKELNDLECLTKSSSENFNSVESKSTTNLIRFDDYKIDEKFIRKEKSENVPEYSGNEPNNSLPCTSTSCEFTAPKTNVKIRTFTPRRGTPKRLREHKTVLGKRPVAINMSPLLKGLKNSKSKITSTRDIILNTIRKDKRSYYLC